MNRNVHKNQQNRNNTDGSSPQSGCLKPMIAGALLTASPFLGMLMKDRSGESSLDLPAIKKTEAVEVAEARVFSPWHRNTAPDKLDTTSKSWVIRSGDTIFDIAKRYSVPADLLMSINNRYGEKADSIHPGQQLILPDMRGVRRDENGWHGYIFELNLQKKSDWVYLCQHLLCNMNPDSAVLRSISCQMQYMNTDLRRAFISEMCDTLRDICKDEVMLPAGRSGNLPVIARVNWSHIEPGKVDHCRQLAGAYCWALESCFQQRSETPVKGEDAVRDYIPHPFRVTPRALIASIESLRGIGFLSTCKFSSFDFGLPESKRSISELTGYPVINPDAVAQGKQPYVLLNFGTGDHNGVFTNAQLVMSAGRKAQVPVVYIESFDAADMLAQSERIIKQAGKKPASLLLGGHGGHSDSECILQVGYTSWVSRFGSATYCLSSKQHADDVARLALKNIVFVSCSSGANLPQGLNFVDATAQAAQRSPASAGMVIFGMNQPSNIYAIKINPDGSLQPTIGQDGSHLYKRTVGPSKPRKIRELK